MKIFKISFKSLIFKITQFILILAMVLVLCQAIAFFVVDKIDNSDLKLEIAIVNLDNSKNMNLILNFALSNPIISDNFNVSMVETEEESIDLLKEKKASAVVLFPENFLDGVIYGANYSPTVYIDTADPIYYNLISNLVISLETVMKKSQSGVYAGIDFNNSDEFIFDVNFNYITFALKGDLYEETNIKYTNLLSMEMHYILSLLIFMLSVSTSIFYKEFNIKSDKRQYKYISTISNNYINIYLSKIFVIYILYAIIFISASVYLGGDFTISSIISLLNATLLFTLIQILIFNVFNSFMSAVQSNFFIHTVSLIISGGLIPTIFMPKIIITIGEFSPTHLIRMLFAPLYINSKTVFADNMIVVTINVLLALYTIYKLREIEKYEF